MKKLFLDDNQSGLPSGQVGKLKRILFRLNNAHSLDDLRDHPNYDLHPLTGSFKGYHAMSVTGNYRIIFRLQKGDVFDIDYLDYH